LSQVIFQTKVIKNVLIGSKAVCFRYESNGKYVTEIKMRSFPSENSDSVVIAFKLLF